MELMNGYKFQFGIWESFCEYSDPELISGLFEKVFELNKTNIQFVTELACVVNLKCWEYYESGNSKLSRIYSDLYYRVREYVLETAYENGTFTDEDIRYYFEVTDQNGTDIRTKGQTSRSLFGIRI